MNKDRTSTLGRISAQQQIVASLVPGSEDHRLATKVLLLLQDSLHLVIEIDQLTAAAEARGTRSPR